jgi:hypothetical protein
MFLFIWKTQAGTFRITFRLYATLAAAYKGLRSKTAAANVGEGAVGMERSGMT